MGSKVTENDKLATGDLPTKDDDAVTRYVLRLKSDYGRYARPADEARRIVDGSMGAAGTLTGLLYKSREDGVA
jgi:hypothetical protein